MKTNKENLKKYNKIKKINESQKPIKISDKTNNI